MAKPWEVLYNIWSSAFSRDLSKEIPHPAAVSGAGIGRADGVGTAEYLEGGSTFNHSVEIYDMNDFLEIGESTDRRARYLEYDRLENIPEISAGLDVYADEVTVPDISGKIFKVVTSSQEVKEELEWLYFKLLQIDIDDLHSWARNLCKNGDLFLEIVMNADKPELGIQKIIELPPETLYRIETVRGKLLEFQQAYMGPDYQVVIDDLNATTSEKIGPNMPNFSPVTTTGNIPMPPGDKMASTVIRFTPEQIIHMRLGLKRRGFYPYGVSILYAGRRIAHILKLMEDAMVVYRLSRSPERRVFYIDIGTLPPHKGEQVLERVKDKIKKKKVFNKSTDQIDERFNVWAMDEDFFIPTRPESNTRIETLPGAQNLDQIGDTKYFREKLMVALKLPKNFLYGDDVATARQSVVAQDIRFAHSVYKIQKIIANGLRNMAVRHLKLKGYDDKTIRDFNVEFTSPSDWIELSRSEILSNRYNLAGSVKASQLYDDFTILTEILNRTEEEAYQIMSRMEKQTLRQQEIQAQAQIFAQLTAPENQNQPQQPDMSQPGGNPMDQMQSLPGGGEMPAGEQAPEGEAAPQQETKPAAKPVKKKKIRDFSDNEADEEEVDINY